MKHYILSPIIALFSAAIFLTACSSAPPEPDATYYLVRHAEKLKGDDPALTPEGSARAIALRERLASVDLTAIYSSDYKRTQETAAPTAAAQNLTVTSYDPRDLPGIAEILKTQTGAILVVGHSNTTPPLAELMGAESGEPIIEATEYDRLYVITRTGDMIEGTIERYGAKNP